MSKRRVVVTGSGLVTSLGCTVESVWQALMAGRSGIATLDPLPADDLRVTFAGRVQGYQADDHFNVKDQRKMDPFIQYAMVAARQAVAEAGLEVASLNAERMGVAVGSGIGGLSMIEDNHAQALARGSKRISPYFIPGTIINMVAGMISIEQGFKGPNISVVTACTTGTHNIGVAKRAIEYGDADVMLAGGSEFASGLLGVGGFAALKALSTRNEEPEKASRPWDKDRDGFVLGDGAGVLVLESLEHAQARGATILAELTGFGWNSDAYHMTQPDVSGAGAARVMRLALEDGQCPPEAVDYINAHGTSTAYNDRIECSAIKQLFGDHASAMLVSSTKSMHGHMLGAAGAVEAIISVLALRHQCVPPTLNLDEPEEGCDLDFVPGKPRQRAIEVALSNSFGFGGTNGCLLFKRWD